MQSSLQFNLPWPPSTNTYYRSVKMGGRSAVLISAAGRDYRLKVLSEVLLQGVSRARLAGSLNVEISAYPPDKRRRDLDNMLKSTLDAIVHAGVIADDSFIDRLCIQRMSKIDSGKILITISRIHVDESSAAVV